MQETKTKQKQDFRCPKCRGYQSGWFEDASVECLRCHGTFQRSEVQTVAEHIRGVTFGVKHDPYEVPEKYRLRDPDRPENTTGFEEEQRHKKQLEMLRRDKRDGLKPHDGGRLTHRVPPELYWARRKQDPDYWKDKKNWDKLKEFEV